MLQYQAGYRYMHGHTVLQDVPHKADVMWEKRAKKLMWQEGQCKWQLDWRPRVSLG